MNMSVCYVVLSCWIADDEEGVVVVCCKLDEIGLTAFVLMLKSDVATACTFFRTLFIQLD